MSRIDSAISIYREKGLTSLLNRTIDHLGGELNRNLFVPLENKYWDLRGTQRFEVGGTVAEFDATQRNGGDVVRGHFESEHPVLTSFVSNLNPEDVVFDIGGHLGLYACFAAKAIVEGRVVVFEPFPPNLVQLLDNVSRNDPSNVRVLGCALSDTDGLIPILSPTLTENYGSPAIGRSESCLLSVPSFAGDSLVECGAVPPPSVVKIDVEGAEGLVLEGFSESLASDVCRRIYCELHPPANHRSDVTDYGDTVADIVDKIRKLGFTIETKHERGSDIQVVGVKK